MASSQSTQLIPIERIESRILFVRGHKVLLDADLAEFYGITTKRLNEQVKRNLERFPEDFMFRLTLEECEDLRSQTATSSWGGRRYQPYVFTEHGALMLGSILKSERAVQVSVYVVRAFVHLRQALATHIELADKFTELELQVLKHNRVIIGILKVLDLLRKNQKKDLTARKTSSRRTIGFGQRNPKES